MQSTYHFFWTHFEDQTEDGMGYSNSAETKTFLSKEFKRGRAKCFQQRNLSNILLIISLMGYNLLVNDDGEVTDLPKCVNG
ncbi:hypothetical protein CFP56_007110 [Quercus suber]|uniref:Uncharacterized protein n=1 Tax=Quercus suber TaxID=58331 RepID=A0AAW0L849_QUESU